MYIYINYIRGETKIFLLRKNVRKLTKMLPFPSVYYEKASNVGNKVTIFIKYLDNRRLSREYLLWRNFRETICLGETFAKNLPPKSFRENCARPQ
jgi:hypothetical protein